MQGSPDHPNVAPLTKADLERSLVERVAKVVAVHPHRIALRDPHGAYTFAELEDAVRAVAGAILASGVDPSLPVALLLDHGAPTVVAILGVLAAGRAYVPLDPAHPQGTLEHVVRDSQAGLVIARGPALALAGELASAPKVIDLDGLDDAVTAPPLGELARCTHADSLACVLYTSGSTGAPKGTMHTHRAIQHLAWSNAKSYGITDDDHLALVFSASYAASLSEIFGAVTSGASLSLVNAKAMTAKAVPGRHALPRSGIGALADWLRSEHITVLKLPVGLFRTFLRSLEPGEHFPDVRLVQLGGEALFRKDVDRFRAHFRDDCLLVNRLASTESLSTTRYPIDRALALGEGVVPVGYPSDDTEVLILDDDGHPLPAGELGQIAVRSRYLARGYWQKPSLTAASFLPGADPDAPPTLLTGDLGRLRPDGCLEHFGRSDQQVKIRGYRVELPAVEAALNALDDVKEAAATAHAAGDDGDTKRLVGYVVPAPGRRLSVEGLRAALMPTLPDFMIPSSFVVLDKLPTTATGKVDRRRLPAPGSVRPLLGAAYVSPRTAIERELSEIWSEVLALPAVGVNDNFFDLGADSLLLLRAHARICAVFAVELPVVALFSHPTIAALAVHMGNVAAQAGDSEALSALRPGAAPRRGQGIAIIGMAGVFPGAADLGTFWHNLRAGVESIRPLTDDELRLAGVDPGLLEHPDFVRTVPELPEFKRFDAEFFGLHPREAGWLDPQHRLLLEVAWHALEHAGYAPEKLAGRIGVFAGTAQSAYLRQNLLPHLRGDDSTDLELRLATDPEFLATRIAYKLNLRGPAINVSTACSTALVAVHLACRSLLDGECEMALAGGAAVETPEATGYRHQAGWITSRDGRCRPFDAKAQGTVFGSGAGMVVLKRLDDAIADRDTILAVIRGSAINNDGAAKVGFAAPSVEGQSSVITAAQAAAEVSAEDIDYVEAHGTGTALGDPIEVAALTKAFRRCTSKTGFCALGSVKGNLGHLSRAAGIAGLIKTVLALAHRELPPSLHCDQPNPAIDWAASPFFVNTTLRPWPTPIDRPRRAAVSSFGVGGTNAHVILEEAPAPDPAGPIQPWQLLPLSARSEIALRESADALAHSLAEQPGQPAHALADVAFTLQTGRQDFAERLVVVCKDHADATEQLSRPSWIDRGHAPASAPSLVFMFPGQGSQYVGMAHGLYDGVPSFRDDVDHCAELLIPELELDLRRVLFADAGDAAATAKATALLTETWLTQPALFVIEWSLARLFMRWGMRPDAMIGHSIGEHVAACVAGVLDVDATLGLIARRGRLIQSLPPGRMLAVHLSEAAAVQHCCAAPGEDSAQAVSLAAVNAPSLCVLAGPDKAIRALMRRLRDEGVDHHLLRTSHAFHSSMMDPALPSFTAEVAGHRTRAPEIPYVSGVTGTWMTAEDAASPDYFSRLLRGTVRFSDGLRTLAGMENAVFVEVGPGRSLSTLGRQHPELEGRTLLSSLRSANEVRADREVLLRMLGELWLHGTRVDWQTLHAGEKRRRVPLPGYPFQRQEYWIPRGTATPAAARTGGTEAGPPRAPLQTSSPPQPSSTSSPPRSRTSTVASDLPSARERVLAAPMNERPSLIAGCLNQIINGLFGHELARPVAADVPLSQLGIDSLMSIQFQARLEADFQVKLSVGAVLSRTIAGLAEEIAGRWVGIRDVGDR